MLLLEGGNEFKLADGNPATKQNASTTDVDAVLAALGKEIGIDLLAKDLEDKWKHKTGSTIYPGAETGDADTLLDPAEFIKADPNAAAKDVQNQFRDWLGQRLQKAGYKFLDKKATVDQPGKYYKVSGDGLTACVQIPNSNEWLQTDLDIAEPGEGKFSVWSKRGEPNEPGTPKDARAKGAYRHILLAAIGSIIKSPEHPQGLSWSFKNGLFDRATKSIVSKDPNEVAQILFGGTAADLENIGTILAKFKQTHPAQYNDVIQNVNAGLEKYKTQYRLKESHPEGSREWFRFLMDHIL
jgi:hypothetical protein